MTKTIHIQYVAMLKDRTGLAEEIFKTKADTVDCLYTEVSDLYKFPWPSSSMRAGINDSIAHWNTPIKDGDRVIFLPPASGG